MQMSNMMGGIGWTWWIPFELDEGLSIWNVWHFEWELMMIDAGGLSGRAAQWTVMKRTLRGRPQGNAQFSSSLSSNSPKKAQGPDSMVTHSEERQLTEKWHISESDGKQHPLHSAISIATTPSPIRRQNPTRLILLSLSKSQTTWFKFSHDRQHILKESSVPVGVFLCNFHRIHVGKFHCCSRQFAHIEASGSEVHCSSSDMSNA